MVIYVMEKNVFGTERLYPVCDKAKALCDALNVKTMTDTAFFVCKALGVTVQIKRGET